MSNLDDILHEALEGVLSPPEIANLGSKIWYWHLDSMHRRKRLARIDEAQRARDCILHDEKAIDKIDKRIWELKEISRLESLVKYAKDHPAPVSEEEQAAPGDTTNNGEREK